LSHEGKAAATCICMEAMVGIGAVMAIGPGSL